VKAIFLIAKRDLSEYFGTLLGYAIIAVLLIATSILWQNVAMGDRALKSSEVLKWFFYFSWGCTCFAGILLSMGVFAREIREDTIVTLYTAPISEWQMVLGKWLGAYGFVVVFIVLTGYMPLMIAMNGQVHPGHLVAGYTSLLMTGALCTAIGTFSSSLTQHQLVAGIVGGLIVGLLIVFWWIAGRTEPPLSDVFTYLSLWQMHGEDMSKGTLHTRDFAYFASLTFLALLGARVVIGARRWR
jgi:ABC-2 type transport system permease protein